MKLVFFGTSDYCLPVLKVLRQNFDLQLVVTRPDKPVGRKKILTSSATKTWAIEHNIPVLTPESLKKDTQDRDLLINQLTNSPIKPDLALVADYGLIIPEVIFNKPRFGTLNIHFSKLPDLRGPSPVQFTLLRGDKDAWITIFKLENPRDLKIKMDSGPILWQQSYPINPDDTTQTLYLHLFQQTAGELPSLVKKYQHLASSHDQLPVQDHSKATYTRFLTKQDGFLNWDLLQQALQDQVLQGTSIQSLPSIQQEALKTKNISNLKSQISNLFDFYRALTPWPGLWTITPEGKRMIVRKCHLEKERLILDEVQFEGKNPTPHLL